MQKLTNIYNKETNKANLGRNTVLHLRYWIGIENRFNKINFSIHDIINMRSMYVDSNLKPFNY